MNEERDENGTRGELPEEIQRWTAKRRAALVLSILKGETTGVEAARKHRYNDEGQKCKRRSEPRYNMEPNGLEMSRPASQGYYRAEVKTWLAGSAPSSCWAARKQAENASCRALGTVAPISSELPARR